MGTMLKISDGALILIGMSIGIGLVFYTLYLYVGGFFDRFKKKK